MKQSLTASFYKIESAPGNTVIGCSTCVERNGGSSGGNCPNGSCSFDMEDDVGGEIIDKSPLVAISLLRPALRTQC
uniref:Uncharacterized protein n=1 Tax=Glossina morsitans morsitans TaxID=37546 RepID=A0A1B0G2A0_GLOMM